MSASELSDYNMLADYEAFASSVEAMIEDNKEGQFVVMHDEKPVCYFDSLLEAMDHALGTYGKEKFIVQKVERVWPAVLYSLRV